MDFGSALALFDDDGSRDDDDHDDGDDDDLGDHALAPPSVCLTAAFVR